MATASWIIVRKGTFEPILETFDSRVKDAINKEKYMAIEILPYLQTLNRHIKSCSPGCPNFQEPTP